MTCDTSDGGGLHVTCLLRHDTSWRTSWNFIGEHKTPVVKYHRCHILQNMSHQTCKILTDSVSTVYVAYCTVPIFDNIPDQFLIFRFLCHNFLERSTIDSTVACPRFTFHYTTPDRVISGPSALFPSWRSLLSLARILKPVWPVVWGWYFLGCMQQRRN